MTTLLHQVIATQVAVVLVLVGATTGGPARLLALALAAIVLALVWLRVRGRWAFEWLTAGLRFGTGRRPAATVLELAAPGTRVTSADLPDGPVAVLADGLGFTALLELGDPADLLADLPRELAAPWELLPADRRERPPCRVQLLLSGVPAPAAAVGSGPVAGSYRALAGGRALGHARAILAVRVLCADGWSEHETRRSLTGLVRRLAKRLPARPLDPVAAVRAVTDLSYADPAAEIHEEWSGLRAGDRSQITFQMPATAGTTPPAALLTELLRLPVAATTVTLTADLPEPESADPPGVGLAVRLTAPDQATLETAASALRRLSADERVPLRRRDGEHLRGLAATLPLGASGDPPRVQQGWHTRRRQSPGPRFGQLVLPTSGTGVVVGRNRHGHPLPIRLFRPEPTRILLVGGLGCAQLLAFRSLAVGARVLVRTGRPREWAVFARGAAARAGTIALAPLDQAVETPPGTPLRPLLTIQDAGPSRALPSGVFPVTRNEATRNEATRNEATRNEATRNEATRDEVTPDERPGGPWSATINVRETFGDADTPTATSADLVLLQPMRAGEADLIGAVLGLGDVARLLTRMRPGMVGIVGHQAVRWAALSPTDVEKVLIGDPSRSTEAMDRG